MLLDPGTDLVTLLRAVVDIESVSGNEKRLADLVEEVLRTQPHLEVARDGDCVVARTRLGRAQRVLIAGHLDTVPVAGNLPSTVEETPEGIVIHGRGTVDMKGGVAVALKLACELDRPRFDITWVFYDHEEVDASLNGLGRLAGNRPDLLEGDFAVLMEPTRARVEGGCQGTIRIRITAEGRAAHSARAWMGDNAIHGLADVLARLAAHEPKRIEVDGLEYREGLNAVRIGGGVRATSSPPRRGWRSTTGSRPTKASTRPWGIWRRSSTGTRSRRPTSPRRPGPGWTGRSRRSSSTRSAGRRSPSTVGPTCPVSPHLGFPRSTTVPGIRRWPTATTNAAPLNT